MFLADIPEAKPALLSLIYVGGVALMTLIMFAGLLLMRRRRRSALEAVAPEDLPPEVRKRLGNFIIAEDDQTLEGVVLAALLERGMRKHRRRAPGHITVESFW